MRFLITLFALFMSYQSLASAQEHLSDYAAHIYVTAQPEDAMRENQFVHIPFLFEMEPGWHIYWKNPGDSGLPTTINTREVSTTTWYPAPETIHWSGMVNYGYKKAVTLYQTVDMSSLDQNSVLSHHIQYLSCKDICIPGEVMLTHDTAGLHEAPNGTLPQTPLDEDPISAENMSLFIALVFAFIGGLILNLMPCVLPVLSLKIMGLTHHQNNKNPWVHGIVYSAGVLVTFLTLAIILISLKGAGSAVGWGYQLQSPLFVASLSFVLLLISLQLCGLFEIGSRLTRLGALDKGYHYSATFLSGILMTFVATPCTAPFMAGAMAYAFTQETFVILLVFAMLGCGLAFPYFILTIKPSMLKILPKPGAWEETLRTFFAFPVWATILWLLWVYGQQTSLTEMTQFLAALLLVSFSIWITSYSPKIYAKIFVLFSIGIAFYVATPSNKMPHWEEWSLTHQEKLLSQNKAVFVDFTADWCVTCKVNELFVFNTGQTKELFEKHNITFLKADWTKKDLDIATELAKYDRIGVPLYVLIAPGNPPVILPQIVTYQILENAVTSNLLSRPSHPQDRH